MIYSDITLAQKLERTEARSCADFVEARASMQPESGATWTDVEGTYAMFDGIGSPLTQSFGLGMFKDANADQLITIEKFFRERGSDVFHEVSPMADQSILSLLSERDYRPIELTSVMYREIRDDDAATPLNPDITTRVIDDSDADLWAETAAAGWATEQPNLTEFLIGLGRIAARTNGGHQFLAELDGRPIAAGGFQMYEDVCILAGASTLPDARRLGAQNALLSARLNFARENGCRFAMIGALPGSQSQKNAQKNGFHIAYTRIKWHLAG